MINDSGNNRPTSPTPSVEGKGVETLQTSETIGQTQDNRTVTPHDPDPNLSVKPAQADSTQTPLKWKPIADRKVSRLPFSGLINRIKNWAIGHGWIKPTFPPNVVAASDLAAQLQGHLGKDPEVTEPKDMRGLQLTGLNSAKLEELLAEANQADGKVVIANVDFAGADFTGVNLSGIQFENCRFDHARLDQCKVYESTFTNCSFGHTTMAKADISDSYFKGCNMNYAKMADVILSESTFANCRTNDKTNLQFAAINECDLTGLPLDEVNMTEVFMVGGKVNTLPLNEKWHKCHLVGVEHERAFAPTGTWGVNGMKFENMTLEFSGRDADDYAGPSFIPTAKFYGCHFINSEVTMEDHKYLCRGCTFGTCPKIALNIYPTYSGLVGNLFVDCANVSSTTAQKYTDMRENQFYDCTVDTELKRHLQQGPRGNKFLAKPKTEGA